MVILVADDDAGVRSVISKILTTGGYTVLTARNGKVALDISRGYQGSICMLLSDVDMPRMGGLALYRDLAAERPGIKALLISGRSLGIEKSLNGLPFLQKPFT